MEAVPSEKDFQDWLNSIYIINKDGEYIDDVDEPPEDPRPDTDEEIDDTDEDDGGDEL
jgi:hypothetical protein